MLTTSNTVSHMMISKSFSSAVPCGVPASHKTEKYDNACFSEYTDAGDSFFMNLVSRMAQDVRTTTTTADIRDLHQAVQADEYIPDSRAIASRILFVTEA